MHPNKQYHNKYYSEAFRWMVTLYNVVYSIWIIRTLEKNHSKNLNWMAILLDSIDRANHAQDIE